MSYTVINSFRDIVIPINKRPLIICDIDHTLLRPKNDFKHYYDIASDRYDSEEDRNEIANMLMDAAYNMGIMKLTDENGFQKLLERINLLNGKLIFLTARSVEYDERTKEDMKIAGFNDVDKFEIYYTNAKVTKGTYLALNDGLLEGYEHIIFIDDLECYLDSVSKKHPYINCYQFKY